MGLKASTREGGAGGEALRGGKALCTRGHGCLPLLRDCEARLSEQLHVMKLSGNDCRVTFPKNSLGSGENIKGFRAAESSSLLAGGTSSVFRAQAAGASAGAVGGPHLGPAAAAALGASTAAANKKRKRQERQADFYAFQEREARRR
ncbi:hypothetical protein cyc_01660, partial [Cyclospora cayetanensis]